ncbi:PA2778 family cysteine peptidase [Pseudodesulfovibrio sp.]|uniref:PA2778 family cysteine peptidase n=1 Tax=Pseudodesulfovibrio sp. TaxID=2035812 RepID=UPI00262A9B6D|nr:PA2778 family cysteine peptidase [Pseudodesulfovibrio sp.]MDD3310729.1 PA2778 family cysteine peptidase [Pseudodesulfovibrio sp.]
MAAFRPRGVLRGVAGLLILLLSAVLGGCALHVDDPLALPDRGAPSVALDVPFFAQEEYQCGPAALAMALGWSGDPATPDGLAPEVYTASQKGSLQPAMVAAARRHGRIAYPLAGHRDLAAELEAGNPVVVLLNLGLSWHPVWHYAVVVGYDRAAGEILLHSGATRLKRYSLSLFQNVWARADYWGLLVLPPDRLPAAPDEAAWLSAAVGLERAGRTGAALTAYETATGRWPASFEAWMGVGNASYAQGLASAAADAFARAAAIEPGNGMAYNNLAYALARLGRKAEAVAAAEKAVACGGPLAESFRRTLDEIR